MGLGRFDEAKEALERGWRLGQEDANARLEGLCVFNLARLARIRKEIPDALRLADSASSVLKRIGASEVPAAAAFGDALRAADRGDAAQEARSLLECGLASIEATDMYSPFDLLSDAEALATVHDLPEVADAARAARDRLASRRADHSAPI
jgi:hypothetical protein